MLPRKPLLCISAPDYTHPLYISGNGVTFTITNNEYSGGFIRDYYISGGQQVLYNEICLVCNQGGSTYDSARGNIGTQTHRWDVLWVDTAHYRDHPSDSSRTKKHDIKPIRETGELIDSLEPVEFIYNDDSSEKIRFGLIYEDTINKLPEICTEDKKTGDLGITYEPLNTILLKEVQELRKRVKELEEKNESYEERLIKLEALIIKLKKGGIMPPFFMPFYFPEEPRLPAPRFVMFFSISSGETS